VNVTANRSVNPARKNGAHGRTRTCTFLIRSQGLYPVELRVRCWRRDGDLNSDCSVENRVSWPLRRSRRIGSPTRTRTWISRVTTGAPTNWMIGEECGGAPRTRTELNLLAREIRGPCACPDWVCPKGARPCGSAGEGGAVREGSEPTNWDIGAWGGFRAHLSAASTRRFHQISFPGEWRLVRPTGIEPVSVRWRRTALPLSYGRVHRAGLEPAKPKAPDLQAGLVAA
jgi:hypothetical protein